MGWGRQKDLIHVFLIIEYLVFDTVVQYSIYVVVQRTIRNKYFSIFFRTRRC